MKNLTPSVYTFEHLRDGDYLYVDKTEYLWELVEPRIGMYFLSRPRRFGKSLTLSTLKAIFQGRRELFKGLAIDREDYDWKTYPVLHLDFGSCSVTSGEELREYLYLCLCAAARAANVHPEMTQTHLGISFCNLISAMDDGNGVVILVDEYDKPLLNMLSNAAAMEEMLPVMKGFYSAIKNSEPHERFVFVTGVTKFCHVSLFSDLNNLLDISCMEKYSTMLGYTQEELERCFGERMSLVESRLSLGHDELLKRLKLWYDGYRFSPAGESVYNPVSIANFFLNDGRFADYWYATGNTRLLFSMMSKDGIPLPELMEQPVSEDLFDSFDLFAVDIQKLMYQTGYLTIGETEILDAGTEFEEHRYHLRFPNNEVRRSFNGQVMEHYAGMKRTQSFDMVRELVSDLKHGDVESFMGRLKVLFAKIPYNLHGRKERDYQSVLYVIFMMLNASVSGEYCTNEGRIDLVLSAGQWTYVIELKLNRSAEEAMTQIRHKDYARGFLGQGRRVIAVGVNFDEERAQIDDWLTEEIVE